MSWTNTPTSTIQVSGWNYHYDSFRSPPTSTSARFALHPSGSSTDIGSHHDIEFRIENGNLVLDVNPSLATGSSANPNAFTHQPPSGALSSQVTSATVNVGDTIRLYTAVGGSLNGSFVISSEFNITASSGGGTGTEGASVNSLYIDSPYPWIAGTIADSEPTGSYPVTVNGSLVQGSLIVNPISHTTGTTTTFSIPIAYGGYGAWHLHQNYVSSALNTPIATVVVSDPSLRRKVFRNFW
jgi:hypothetical protein